MKHLYMESTYSAEEFVFSVQDCHTVLVLNISSSASGIISSEPQFLWGQNFWATVQTGAMAGVFFKQQLVFFLFFLFFVVSVILSVTTYAAHF